MLVYIRQDDHRALKCPREPSGTCGHTSLLLSWKATLCTLTKGLGFIKERMPVPNENYYYNTLQTILLHAPLVEKWRRYSHLRFAFETHRNYVTCCKSHTDLITFTEMKKVTPLNKTIITKIILMSVSSFSELDMSFSSVSQNCWKLWNVTYIWINSVLVILLPRTKGTGNEPTGNNLCFHEIDKNEPYNWCYHLMCLRKDTKTQFETTFWGRKSHI